MVISLVRVGCVSVACLMPCMIAAAQAPIVPVMPAAEVGAADVAGNWSGFIKIQGMELRIEVRIQREGESLTGKIDIPQQGARDLPLADVKADGNAVSFRIDGIPGDPTFKGTLGEDGRITGEMTQGPMTAPFELKRGALAKAKRPQNPQPPFPYAEEEVRAANGEVTLAGTLTRPPGDGPFPAVILVSGSGPQNRDEEIFEHRPFAVWADQLSRAGIIVLRYDDRGVGESTGVHAQATTTMLADDAEAWVAVLKGRKDVAAIGIMGHSEGGIIAPMVAARNPDVAFVVMLAGTGVNGAEVLVEQNRALALAAGAAAPAAELIAGAARAFFAALEAGAEGPALREAMMALVRAQVGEAAGDADLEQAIERGLAGLESPWFKEFLTHDPAGDLRKVNVPLLALFGERDAQVVPAQNAPVVEAAVKGNSRATVRVLPGLNHLFQEAKTGSVAEYDQIEQTLSPGAIEVVREWILKNAAGRE